MGNAVDQYQIRRDEKNFGTEIDEPKDWFEFMIQQKYDQMKPMYDELPTEDKEQFVNIFEGTDVMASKEGFQSWLNENSFDIHTLGD